MDKVAIEKFLDASSTKNLNKYLTDIPLILENKRAYLNLDDSPERYIETVAIEFAYAATKASKDTLVDLLEQLNYFD